MIPTVSSTVSKTFIAVAPSDHILSEKEWDIVINDNVAVMGKLPKRSSKYKMSELRIFHAPFSEEAKELIARGV